METHPQRFVPDTCLGSRTTYRTLFLEFIVDFSMRSTHRYMRPPPDQNNQRINTLDRVPHENTGENAWSFFFWRMNLAFQDIFIRVPRRLLRGLFVCVA